MSRILLLETDQGNGCAVCEKCSHVLSEDPLAALPKECPKCGERFEETVTCTYNYGGSDFS